jgi:ribonuclease I
MGLLRAALCGAALALCARACAASGCDADPSFDYFMLALQWPASFGAVRKGYWTLHGLWPSRAGAGRASGYPCACSDEPFDSEKVAAIRPELDKFWPTLFAKHGGGDESFWGHEWSKHGTCSRFGSQLSYFNSTLATRAKYDPDLALAPPATLLESTVVEIKSAVRKTFGFAPMLGCKDRKEEGRQYLSEIGYCLTTELQLQVRRLTSPCAALPADHALASLTMNIRQECDSSVERIRDEVNDCDPSRSVFLTPSDEPIMVKDNPLALES